MGCCLKCCHFDPEEVQEVYVVNSPKREASSHPISRDNIKQIQEPHEDLKNSRADLVESSSK